MIKRTTVWMLEDDTREFGRQAAQELPSAWWMCSRSGPRGLLRQVHAHSWIGEALECGGGGQAFLPLPAGAEPPQGSVVGAEVRTQPGTAVSALVQFQQTVRRPAGLFGAGHLQAGRLAVSFGEELQRQVDQVWAALSAVTQDADVSDAAGNRLSEARIGPAAREVVAGQGMELSLGGEGRFRLVG